MSLYPTPTAPGDGLLIRYDDETARLTYLCAALACGKQHSEVIAATPAVREALAGGPYTRVHVAADGTVRLHSGTAVTIERIRRGAA
jgi:hypothetical protein